MIRAKLLLVAMGVAIGAGASPLAARQARVNPHGTLPEGVDCSACHTVEGWVPLRDTLDFVHGARSGFVLSGAHTQVACAGCHLDLHFDGPDVQADDCASCHADVHEGRMMQSCASCHTTRSFERVDGETVHARTTFPLTGAHRQVTCESCHVDDVGGAFTPLPTDCVSCHQTDYRGARAVDHVSAGYPTSCTECHSTVGWGDAPAFDHLAVSGGFALVGAHDGLQCASCHRAPGMEPLFAATGQEDCASCHRTDYDREHGASGFPSTCLSCHTVGSWSGASFDHATSGFALQGSHAQLQCTSCHTEGDRALRFPAPANQEDCASCHQSDYDHEHAGSGFPMTCQSCHGLDRWEGASFDHASTGFPLVGAHEPTACAECHGAPAHLSALPVGPEDCVACHQADYDEDHGGSSIPTTCLECHTQSAWEGATFDHASLGNGFALEGPHATAECATCHSVPDYGLLFPQPSDKDDCVVCHQVEFDQEHAGSGYPTTCLSCHAADRWEGTTFDHGTTTFPLVGAHVPVDCTSCHGPPGHLSVLPAEPQDCVACHQADYDEAHAGSEIPTTCLECHSQSSWEGANLDHVAVSGGFALDGPHAIAACASCHSVPDYALLFPQPSGQNDCAVCHQADYDANHAGSGFPTTCVSCHAPDRWEGATFDHGTTGYPLVGAHAPAPCASCHGPPGHLSELPSGPQDCVACHQADYDGEHSGSGFPTTCLECHNQSSWEGATVDHAAVSGGFVLDGPHATAACTACHSVPDYALLFPEPSGNNDCVSCHQADYDANHAGSGFPTTCVSCHAPDRWGGATFDHGTTGYPLVGAHAPAPCASCHGPPGHLSELPSGPQDCVACHQADYDGEHSGSGFPTTCLECHNQSSWEGATVDHAAVSGGFVLQGPHATAQCTACHSVPDYALLFPEPSGNNDCVSCHQADYDANHAGSGFPTTCLTCHQSNTWSGATLDHPSVSGGFQLLGAHAAAACTACHSIPGYGLLFPDPANQNDCVACHQTDYDREHGGSGYPTDCTTCHTTSAWEPSTFNHDSSFFPIYSGSHRGKWDSCNDCHLGGNFSDFTCTTCHTPGNTNGDHDEVRSYVYESHACFSCHPRGRSG